MARGPEVRIATLATDGVERRDPGAPRSVAAHRESAEPMVDVAATVSRSCDPWHDMTEGQVRHLTLTEAVRRRKHRALIRLRTQTPTADVEQVATTEEFLVSCRKARG
jgi:hypothetical protein